jgi:hypothetical protein
MASGPFYKPGRYACVFTGHQGFSVTSKGNSQFFCDFRVEFIMEPGGWVELTNKYVRTYKRVINANTAEWAAEDLRALGFTGDKFMQLDPRYPQALILAGQIEMVCNHKPGVDGSGLWEDWGPVRDSGSSTEVELADSKAIKQLDLLFGKALKGEKITPAAQPVPAAAAPGRISGLPPRPAPATPGLVSQPRSAQRPAVPDAIQDPATGYAMDPQPPKQASAVGAMEITDDDIPF